MRNPISTICALSLMIVCSFKPTIAQETTTESSPAIPARVMGPVDETRLVQLAGNTHPLARPEFDRGPVDPAMPLERMILVLERSPEQEAQLTQFMARQLDPASPDYHHWLQPAEFGALYGPASSDIQTVTSWLEWHGFSVDRVSVGRNFIEFSGTAAMAEKAFHTELHRFNVNGEEHIANTTDPSIPEALRPVVAGVMSLNNFFARTHHTAPVPAHRDSQSGNWLPDTSGGADPLFGLAFNSTNYQLVSPYDFATIYNVTSLWNANIDGTGQTIAIAGRSNISLADVATFRSAFGLPANVPTVVLNGADPGFPSDNDRQESSLDVEWAGAVAKGAKIKLVITQSTATTDGAQASAQYIIDNKLASVLNFSFGKCELDMGTTLNTAANKMWQQGAAEGISIFVSSGDRGASDCDVPPQGPTAAQYGLEVNGYASTPYAVAVGGTDLIWANLTTTYWNKTNAANGSSALGYIPEVPWNGTCASDDVDKLIGDFKLGYDEEGTCNYIMSSGGPTKFVTVKGGGGGVSACTAPTGTLPNSCTGGYSKPAWQTGTGVPADKKRDIPDLALFASGGVLDSAYLFCESSTTPCTYSNAGDAAAQTTGGTSVASPAMAGIMALVLQKQGGVPQGLPNPVFYKLASKEDLTSCNSLAVSAGNNCVFYDISEDNIAQPCAPGTPNCTVENKSDNLGILSGYKATTGYDLATGLGSVNANNLVNAWSATAPGPAVSLSTTTLTFPSTAVGSSSPSQVITVTNTGGGWLVFPSGKVGIFGGNYSSFPSTTTCTAPIAPGGKCVITVTFKPTMAGPLASTAEAGDNAPGSPQQVALVGTATGGTPAVTLSASTLTFPSTMVGQTSAAQTVTVKSTGTGVLTFTGPGVFLSGGSTNSFVLQTNCSGSLNPGSSCSATINFKPQTAGSLLANLEFFDNVSGSPQNVVLKGTATPGPTLQLSSSSVSFYSTQVGSQSVVSEIYGTNTSPYPIAVNAPSVTGPNASSFIVLNNCPASLSGGSSCYFYIAFKPVTAGSLTATLSISDSADKSVQSVALSGTSVAVPNIGINPTAVTFPATAKGTLSTVIPITLSNLATSTSAYIQMKGITITGANASSFVQVSDCNGYLIPGLSCHVYVSFAPTAVGPLKATLTITDTGAGSPQSVALTGTGK